MGAHSKPDPLLMALDTSERELIDGTNGSQVHGLPIMAAMFIRTVVTNSVSHNLTGWHFSCVGEFEATKIAVDKIRLAGHEAFYFALPGQFRDGTELDTRLR